MKLHHETFDFLSELKENNNRDWFNERKDTFIKIKENFEAYVDGLIQDILPIEPDLKGLTGKKSVMRIYRDVRFSLDKSPYKINLGASLHEPNHKGNFPGYFLSIGPDSSFLAGGYWMPDSATLKAIRQEIDYHPEIFKALIEDADFKKTFGDLGQENKLIHLPKGYTEDNLLIEYLKLKSFTASLTLSDAELVSGKAYDKILKGLKTLQPLIKFLRNIGPEK